MENSLVNFLLFFKNLIDNYLKKLTPPPVPKLNKPSPQKKQHKRKQNNNKGSVNQRNLNSLENAILSVIQGKRLTLEEIKREFDDSQPIATTLRELTHKGWIFCNRDKFSYVRDDEAIIFIARKCNEVIRDIRPMNNKDLSDSLLLKDIKISKRGVNRILYSNLNRHLVSGPNHNPDDPLWF